MKNTIHSDMRKNTIPFKNMIQSETPENMIPLKNIIRSDMRKNTIPLKKTIHSDIQKNTMPQRKYLTNILGIMFAFFLFMPWTLPQVHASVGDELDRWQEDIDNALGNSDETSFTDFSGDFKAPPTDIYSASLTSETSVRGFILRLTNFILSFLGIAAVIAIIYGGILYVTSGGEEDSTTKGKKTITYALMGIVIVLISFALVNTLISGVSTGVEPGGTNPAGPDENIAVSELYQTSTYDAKELVQIAKKVLQTYSNHANLKEGVEQLSTFLENASSLDKDYAGKDKEMFRNTIAEVRGRLQGLLNETEELSTAAEKIKNIISYIDQLYIAVKEKSFMNQGDILQANILQPNIFQTNISNTSFEDTRLFAQSADRRLLAQTQGESSAVFNCTDNDSNCKAILSGLKDKIIELDASIESDYNDRLGEQNNDILKIKTHFDDVGIEGSPLMAFDEVTKGILELYGNGANNAQAEKVVDDFKTLITLVKEIKAVRAVIKASTKEANAPITVILDATFSQDPTGQTIPSENFEWDLDGDGNFNDLNNTNLFNKKDNNVLIFQCNSDTKTRGIVACTFEEPSAYTSTVRIKSQDSTKYAMGEAKITIKVNPPLSKIVLTATSPSGSTDSKNTTVLADFRNDPSINRESYKLTLAEAQSGIDFDASNTGTLEGVDIKFFTWNFGDGSGKIAETTGKQTYKYGKEGQYAFTLEVEDTVGNKNIKKVNLFVGSPTARIRVTPESGDLTTVFTISGKESRTDAGQIIRYNWILKDKDSKELSIPDKNAPSFEYQFAEPGTYTINLTVEDSTDKSDTATEYFSIISREPVAIINATISDPSQPNTVYFDASQSYDPDPGQQLKSYQWDVVNLKAGTDYAYISGKSNSGVQTAMQFFSTGTKEITLTVTDKDGKNNTSTKSVKIDSILDVRLSIGGDPDKGESETFAYQLKENTTSKKKEVKVAFIAKSAVAVAYEINFGDGNRETFAPTKENGKNKNTTIEHIYTKSGTLPVKLTAYDGADNDNATTKNLYIGSGDTPIAVMHMKVDGNEVTDTASQTKVYRTSSLEFDAGNSINIDGTGRNLNYVWSISRAEKMSDGTLSAVSGTTSTSQEKNLKKVFTDQGFYKADLTVSNRDNANEKAAAAPSIIFEVIPSDPSFETITITPPSGQNVTPLKVRLTAIGAKDPDGQVKQYRWWYYPLGDTSSENRKGFVLTETPETTMTINTYTNFDALDTKYDGKVVYGFGLEITDNEGNIFTRDSGTETGGLPQFTVTNGPNNPPTVTLYSDKTSILVGESVNFTVKALDPDGEIEKYEWDIDGDGFFTSAEGKNTSIIQNTFTKFQPNGIRVKVKVTDKNGSETISSPIIIYVDSNNEPPKADFSIKNTTSATDKMTVNLDASGSKSDPDLKIQRYIWDCDTNKDSDLDGFPANDEDEISETSNQATCEYVTYGTVKIKLTIIDTEGNSNEKIKGVSLSQPDQAESPVAAFSFKLNGTVSTFDALNSIADSSKGASIKKWMWDADTRYDENGDGDPQNDNNAKNETSGTFSYDYAGNYGNIEAKLTVTDNLGKSDDVKRIITIPKPGETPEPEPAFTYQASQGDPLKITFDVGNSASYNGALEYFFDFDTNTDSNGNGKKDDDTDRADTVSPPIYIKKFTEYGTYRVKLTVTDNQKKSSSITQTIDIREAKTLPPPEAHFSYSIDRDNGKKVYFNTGESFSWENPDTLNLQWDFDTNVDMNRNGKSDDDNERADQIDDATFAFIFDNYGTYAVQLETSDVKGKKGSVMKTVNLPEPPASRPPDVAFTYKQQEKSKKVDFNGSALSFIKSKPDLETFWDFDTKKDADGNGNGADDKEKTSAILTMEFPDYGTYSVKWTAKDAEGNENSVTRTVSVLKEENQKSVKPIAAFVSLASDKKVSYTNNSQIDASAASTVIYQWDFDASKDSNGDGKKDNDIDSTEKNSLFTYTDYGTYKVQLSVIDGLGNSDAVIQSVFVEKPQAPGAPIAAFTYTTEGKKVQFQNTSKASEGASLQSYEWDFDGSADSNGDGKKTNDKESSSVSPSFEYKNYGTYKVSLKVTDNFGSVGEIINSITMTEPEKPHAPEAAFIYEISGGDAKGKTVVFDGGNSRGDADWVQPITINEYLWDFDAKKDENGNGKTNDDFMSGNPVSHEFSEYTTYNVLLKVKDSAGASGEVTRSVTISQPKSSSLDARLISSPAALASDGKIHLQDEIGYVNFDTSGSQGDITQYLIDKNVSYDSNGNGKKDDDTDLAIIKRSDGTYERKDSFSKVEYEKSWGRILTQLTVKNDRSESDRVSVEIVFDDSKPSSPPKAAFTYRVDDDNSKKIHFTASTSTSEAPISKYVWDFNTNDDFNGDGNRENDEESNVIEPEKIYGESGNFTVKLKVIDEKGLSDEISRSITIPKDNEIPAPIAAFTYEIDPSDTSSLTARFDASGSTADSATKVVGYKWDFDLNTDSNGDGIKDNDKDSEEQKPVKKYSKYQNYQVKLKVTDALGKIAEVTRTLSLSEPSQSLDARVITNPATSVTDGKVHLQGDKGFVGFDYSSSIGPIAKYVLDKNVYYDTNGNGIKNDDADLTATTAGKWDNIEFQKEWGTISAKLTVYDQKGKSDYVNIDIVFDSEKMGTTSVLDSVNNLGMFAVIAVMGVFAIVGIILGMHPLKRFIK
ncbi:PKD domain-containing protein [Candidatus Peregrinibacteria bacterium]|nr:PKD domain-containing protein [Candidatus Peregrinibacteria bacterium]